MRTENEIQEIKQELETLTGFIADFGTEQEFKHKCVGYSCNVVDALCWVLSEIGTEGYKSDNYLDLAKLHAIVRKVEQRTGKKKENSA